VLVALHSAGVRRFSLATIGGAPASPARVAAAESVHTTGRQTDGAVAQARRAAATALARDAAPQLHQDHSDRKEHGQDLGAQAHGPSCSLLQQLAGLPAAAAAAAQQGLGASPATQQGLGASPAIHRQLGLRATPKSGEAGTWRAGDLKLVNLVTIQFCAGVKLQYVVIRAGWVLTDPPHIL
jgi:hypothetical protein